MTVIGAQIYKDCSLDVDLGSNSLSLCFSSILNVYLSWEISSEWYLSTISDPYCSLHNFDSLFIQISSFEFLFMFLFFNFPLLWLPWFWRSILFINHKEKIEPWTRGSRTYALTGRDFVHKHFICNLFFKKKNSNRKYTNKVLFFLFISEIEFKNICMVIHLVHFIIVWISKFWISFCFLKDK